MTFPDIKHFNLVVAAIDENGDADFLPFDKPAVLDIPDAVESAIYWTTDGGHRPGMHGGTPAQHQPVSSINGSSFGVHRFPAHSAGKLDLHTSDVEVGETGHEGNLAMHETKTVDYDIILSGKVDIQLPGGKVRTVSAGDLIVMRGIPHAWQNRYDEDCVWAAVTIGHNS